MSSRRGASRAQVAPATPQMLSHGQDVGPSFRLAASSATGSVAIVSSETSGSSMQSSRPSTAASALYGKYGRPQSPVAIDRELSFSSALGTGAGAGPGTGTAGTSFAASPFSTALGNSGGPRSTRSPKHDSAGFKYGTSTPSYAGTSSRMPLSAAPQPRSHFDGRPMNGDSTPVRSSYSRSSTTHKSAGHYSASAVTSRSVRNGTRTADTVSGWNASADSFPDSTQPASFSLTKYDDTRHATPTHARSTVNGTDTDTPSTFMLPSTKRAGSTPGGPSAPRVSWGTPYRGSTSASGTGLGDGTMKEATKGATRENGSRQGDGLGRGYDNGHADGSGWLALEASPSPTSTAVPPSSPEVRLHKARIAALEEDLAKERQRANAIDLMLRKAREGETDAVLARMRADVLAGNLTQAAVRELESQISACRAREYQASDQASAATRELHNLRSELAKALERANRAEAKAQRAIQDASESHQSAERLKDSLVSRFVSDATMSLEDDRAAHQEEVSRLHDDLIAARREAATARREQAGAESQATELRRKLTRVQAELQAKSELLEDSQQEVSTLLGRVTAAERSASNARASSAHGARPPRPTSASLSDLSLLSRQKTELEDEVSQLKSKLSERDQQLADARTAQLRAERDRAQAQSNSAVSKMRTGTGGTAEIEADQLRQQLGEMQRKVTDLEIAKAAAEQNASRTAILAELGTGDASSLPGTPASFGSDAESSRLRAKIEDMQLRLERAEAVSREATSSLSTLRDQKAQEHSRLSSALETARARGEDLARELASARSTASNQQAALQAEVEKLKTAARLAKEDRSRMESELALFRKSSSRPSSAATVPDSVGASGDIVASLHEEIRKLKQINAAADERAKDLSEQLLKLAGQSASDKSNASALEQQCESLKRSLQHLREMYDDQARILSEEHAAELAAARQREESIRQKAAEEREQERRSWEQLKQQLTRDAEEERKKLAAQLRSTELELNDERTRSTVDRESERQSFQDTISDLREDNRAVQLSLEESERRVRSLQSEVLKHQEEMQRTKYATDAAAQKHKLEQEALLARIEQTQERLEAEKSHLEEAHRAELSRLRDDLEAARQSLADAEKSWSETRREMYKDHESAVSSINAELASVRDELARATTARYEADAEHDRERFQMQADHESAVHKLENKASVLESEVESLRARMAADKDSWEQEREMMRRSMDQSRAEFRQELEAARKVWEDSKEAIEHERDCAIKEKTEEAARLREAIADGGRKLQEEEKRHHASRLELMREKDVAVDAIRKELAEWKDRFEAQREQIAADHRREMASLGSQLEDAREALAAARRELGEQQDNWFKTRAATKREREEELARLTQEHQAALRKEEAARRDLQHAHEERIRELQREHGRALAAAEAEAAAEKDARARDVRRLQDENADSLRASEDLLREAEARGRAAATALENARLAWDDERASLSRSADASLEEARQEIRTHSETIVRLREEITSHTETIHEKESVIVERDLALEQALADAEASKRQMGLTHEAELSSLRAELDRATQRMEAAGERAEQLLRELEALRSRHSEQMDGLRAEHALQCERLREDTKERDETLSAEKDSHETTLQAVRDAQAQKSAAEARCSEMQEQLTRLDLDCQQRLEDLRSQLDREKDRAVEDEHAKFMEANAELHKLKLSLDSERRQWEQAEAANRRRAEDDADRLRSQHSAQAAAWDREREHLASQHEAALAAVRRELASTRERMESENSRLVTQHELTVGRLQDDLANAKNQTHSAQLELTSARSGWDAARAALERDHGQELSDLKLEMQRLRDEIQRLEAALRAARDENDGLQSSIATADEAASAAAARVERLEQSLESEREAHEAALDAAIEKHQEEREAAVQAVEARVQDLREDLQRAEQDHARVLDRQKEEANRREGEWQDERDGLQARIRELQDQLEALRYEHSAAKQGWELERESLKRDAEESGRRHADELQEAKDAAENEIADLTSNHKDEISRLEAALRTFKQEHELRMDTVSHEHEAVVSSRDDEIARLQSALDDIRADAKRDVDRLEAALQQARDAGEKSLADRRQEWDDEMDDLRRRHQHELELLGTRHAEALRRLQAEAERASADHARTKSRLEEELAALRDELNRAKVEYAQKERDSQEDTLQKLRANSALMEQRSKDHDAALEAVRQDLAAARERLRDAQDDHDRAMRDAEAKHADEVRDRDAEIERLKRDLSDAEGGRERDKDRLLAELSDAKERAAREAREAQERYDNATKKLNDDHEEDLERLRRLLGDDLDAANKERERVEEELNSRLAAEKEDWQKVVADLEARLKALAADHAAELAALRAQLEDAGRMASGAQQQARADAEDAEKKLAAAIEDEAQKWKARLDQAEREAEAEKAVLQGKLDGSEQDKALTDAELQRLRDELAKAKEAAEKECEALKEGRNNDLEVFQKAEGALNDKLRDVEAQLEALQGVADGLRKANADLTKEMRRPNLFVVKAQRNASISLVMDPPRSADEVGSVSRRNSIVAANAAANAAAAAAATASAEAVGGAGGAGGRARGPSARVRRRISSSSSSSDSDDEEVVLTDDIEDGADVSSAVSSRHGLQGTEPASDENVWQFKWCRNGLPLNKEHSAELVLGDLSGARTGRYTCEASRVGDSDVCVSHDVFVRLLQTAPKVYSTTPSQSIELGKSITLEVNAFAEPDPQFQWHFKGHPIDGETSSKLVVSGMDEDKEGDYKCLVSNDLGTASSAVVSLSLQPAAPTIIRAPSSIKLNDGEDVELTVEAVGLPAPQYQWMLNGEPVKDQTEPKLLIRHASKVWTGSWRCMVSNRAGIVHTDPVEVALNGTPPSFTTHPEPQRVSLGDFVTLEVVVEGDPSPTLQWMRNGEVLEGETSSQLSILNVTPESLATYTCVASNRAGSATSDAADLTALAPPPKVVSQSESCTAIVGSDVVLSVEAAGAPPLRYRWTKDGASLAGQTLPELTLSPLMRRDFGEYVCIVSSDDAASTTASKPMVISNAGVPARIVSQPETHSAVTGEDTSFECEVEGVPEPTMYWEKDGIRIPGARSAKLVINDFSDDDVGEYVLVVRNDENEDSVRSKPVKVSAAAVPPEIVSQSESRSVDVDSEVILTVVVKGSPEPDLQWEKDGVPLPDRTSHKLRIPSFTEEHAGSYTLIARNSAAPEGVRSGPIVLSIDEEPPTFLSQSDSRNVELDDEVVLTVKVAGTPQPTLQWEKDGKPIPGMTSKKLRIDSFTEADAGEYVAVAANKARPKGVRSEPIIVQLLSAAPQFTRVPESQTLDEDEEVVVAMKVIGMPPPTFIWEKDGQILEGQTTQKLRISRFSEADAGDYVLIATNSAAPDGVRSPVVSLSLDSKPPTFTSQTESLAVDLGEEVVLEVGVYGVPAPSLQWEKDGELIEGATNHKLRLLKVKAEDLGSYVAVASNSVAPEGVRSDPIVVALDATKPKIVGQDDSKVVPLGSPVSLTVTATGTEPMMTYQWYSGDTVVPDATSATLSFEKITLDDFGDFSCTVTNSAGSVSSGFISIYRAGTAPEFISHSKSQEAELGSSITLEVEVQGFPTPTLQWMKDGTDIEGEVAEKLVIREFKDTDAGTYVCVARNASDEEGVETGPIHITLHSVKPTIVNQSSSQKLALGATAVLEVTADGTEPLTYQWSRDGDEIDGAADAKLTLEALSVNDFVEYTCTVSNAGGSTTSEPITLTRAERAPEIISQSESQEVELDGLASLEAEVIGFPTPTLQWEKDGSALPGKTELPLVITSFSAADEGEYVLVARNSANTAGVRSQVIHLTRAGVRPVIISHTESGEVPLESSMKLQVVAESTPPPTYQWQFEASDIPGATEAELPLDSIAVDQFGTYRCVVSNTVGSITSDDIVISRAPSLPVVTCVSASPVSADNGGPAVFEVSVTGYPDPTLQWYFKGEALEGATSARYELPAASMDTCGAYRCRATNRAGSVDGDELLLHLKPYFTSQSEMQEVELHTDVGIFAEACGFPEVSYSWTCNNEALPDALESTLSLRDFSAMTPQTFVCTATNAAGSATSHDIVVQLSECPPVIVEDPCGEEVEPLSRVVLEIKATGVPTPEYQWYLNDAPVEGATSPQYVIERIIPSQFGKYHCTATNRVGSATSEKASISAILGPLDPFVIDAKMWELTIGWKPYPMPLKQLVVTALYTEFDDATPEDFTLPGDALSLHFEAYHDLPIDPDEEFKFTVRGELEDGTWVDCNQPLIAATLKASGRAVLIGGRFPRVFIARPVMFDQNKETIKKGGDKDVPALTDILKEHPELRLSIEGHVNFGQREEDALKLSTGRARQLRIRISSLGIPRERLEAVGFGYKHPRFAARTKGASKNRRVEFKIIPPDGSAPTSTVTSHSPRSRPRSRPASGRSRK